jgi:septum formation inhibitor-activating ATPase MinD
LQRKYEHAEDFAIYLNAMMPYDISFGGRYVLCGYDDIKAACIEEGIEYRHALAIQKVFNRIHVLDVVTKINNGVSRQALIRAGYPKSLIQNIAKRQQQNEYLVSDISDELVCYLHDGEGKWIVTASEDGLETGFIVRFMPYKRYQFKWWDYE